MQCSACAHAAPTQFPADLQLRVRAKLQFPGRYATPRCSYSYSGGIRYRLLQSLLIVYSTAQYNMYRIECTVYNRVFEAEAEAKAEKTHNQSTECREESSFLNWQYVGAEMRRSGTDAHKPRLIPN